MRWTIFAIFAYLALALDLGFASLLQMEIAHGLVAPSFVFILMVYIAANSPPREARISAIILGLLVDLTWPHPLAQQASAIVIGPAALGFLLGAILTIQLRSLVYRRHPLTMGLLTFIAGCCAYLPIIFLLLLRRLVGQLSGSSQVIEWHAADQLVHFFLVSVYSGLAAVPAGYILDRISPLFGFQTTGMMTRHR